MINEPHNPGPDKKALSILAKYDLLHPEDTSKTDTEYAVKMGLMFDPVHEEHDLVIENLFKTYSQCRKKHITDLFIASLSANRPEWRTAFAIYAIMQTFPKHLFAPAGAGLLENQCRICSNAPKQKTDLSFANQTRFFAGGIIDDNIYYYNFFLTQHQLLPRQDPNSNDFRILNLIFERINEAGDKETPSTLQKKLGAIKEFKSTEEQRTVLIESLGYSSILETKVHRGFLHKYTDLSLAPKKSRSSDWQYPVDWWTGKDGLNREALRFLFGENELLSAFY
ncbi:MAG: hypothetical protein ICV83_11450 [Cytophagales bacterium]|nr:hypothetical protein [Cytophagales bacterium]